MQFIKPNNIEWKEVKYLRKGESFDYQYSLMLNEPLASWDVFDYWERERINSMEKNLTKKDILFDIGTEQGWCNLVYAQIVGPENIVLIEPTPEFWPNIYCVWYKNFKKTPRSFYDGLFSDKTTDSRIKFRNWPDSCLGDIIDRNKYIYIHENEENIPEITLDEFVKRTGVKPTALTMDTEGSELLILKGAEQTLINGDLKLWISIHDDLAERDYGVMPGQTISYLESLGYSGEFLALDHEAHWYFSR